MIGEHMAEHGVRFLRGWVPTGVKLIEEAKDGKAPRLLVSSKQSNGDQLWEEEFNTVVFAIGRDPCTADLKLEKAGVQCSEK